MKNVQKPLAMVVASVVTLPSTFMGLVVEDLAPLYPGAYTRGHISQGLITGGLILGDL